MTKNENIDDGTRELNDEIVFIEREIRKLEKKISKNVKHRINIDRLYEDNIISKAVHEDAIRVISKRMKEARISIGYMRNLQKPLKHDLEILIKLG